MVIAIALLALGAALLAGSSQAATASARAEASHEASLLAEAESRVALAEVMAGWGGAEDALSIGNTLARLVGPRQRGLGNAVVQSKVRLQRLTQLLYVMAVDCQVGPDDAVSARRRVLLLLRRPLQMDSTAPILPPVPLGRWSLADLF